MSKVNAHMKWETESSAWQSFTIIDLYSMKAESVFCITDEKVTKCCVWKHKACLVRKLKNVFVHTWCVWLRGWRNSWSRFVLSTPPLAAVFYGIVEYVTVWYCIWKSMVWVWHWYYVALFCEAEYDMLEYNMEYGVWCGAEVWYVVNCLRGTSLKWQSVIYSKYSNDTVWHGRA